MKPPTVASLMLVVFLAAFTISGQAQTPSVTGVTAITSGCGSDFFSDSGTPAICYNAVVTNCPNADDLELTFSYDSPGSPIGVIVMLPGGSGKAATAYPGAELTFAQYYFSQGYAVVQVAWAWDWEDTTIPLPYTGGSTVTSYVGNIKAAACRPATFVKYINDSPAFHPSGTAMCAQGASAGSGAVGYTLAWYGGSSYLKNVELLSGPVFSDIEKGCVVPRTGPQTICGSGQYGCSSGTTSWSDAPQYVANYLSQIRNWSGDTSCLGSGSTSGTSNTNWTSMSIVSTGANLSYSSTGMAGWLCATSVSCDPDQGCPNNSAAEGEYFYTNFTSSSHPLGYLLTGITSCNGAEGVAAGDDPDLSGETGKTAIENHMTAHCTQ